MFPLSDENPHFLTPYTSYALIALNIAAWIFVQGLGMEPRLGASVCTLGLVPGELLQTLAPGTTFQVGPNAFCTLTDTPNWLTTNMGRKFMVTDNLGITLRRAPRHRSGRAATR